MTLSSLDLGLPPWEIVGILTGGLALSSFALSGTENLKIHTGKKWLREDTIYFLSTYWSLNTITCFATGLYCSHQDISPEYASILLVCEKVIIFHFICLK